MKTKKFFVTLLSCILLVTVVGSTTISAAPKDNPNPPVLWDVFVINTSENPVPVEIAEGELDVNLDEPIEVTNPDGESLAVEVTNLEDLTLDVSGWLHTTDEGLIMGYITYEDLLLSTIDTRGYRQITLISSSDIEPEVWVEWVIGESPDELFYWEDLTYSDYGPAWGAKAVFDVKGPVLQIMAFAEVDGEAGDFKLGYYLTT